MKPIGELCNVDKLGRIVIPKSVRNKLMLDDKSCLELFIDGENIIMQKYLPQCVFCGDRDNLEEYKGKCICSACKADICK